MPVYCVGRFTVEFLFLIPWHEIRTKQVFKRLGAFEIKVNIDPPIPTGTGERGGGGGGGVQSKPNNTNNPQVNTSK
jgi:hypothetical protein